MQNYQKYFPVFFLSLLIFGSCKKYSDLDKLEVTGLGAEYAIPLINAKTTMGDILGVSGAVDSIAIDDDKCIRLFYRGDIVASTSQEIIDIIPWLPMDLTDTVTTQTFPFPDGIFINYINLKGGEMVHTAVSEHDDDMDVRIWIPQMTKISDGSVFEIEFTIDASVGTSFSIPGLAKPVAGYRLGAETDSLTVHYEAFHENGEKDTLTEIGILGLEFAYSFIEGYLGNEAVQVDSGSIEIDFFDKWVQGNIYFADPKIYLTVKNSFGFPVKSVVHKMEVRTINGEILPLVSTFVTDGIHVNYPTFAQIGETIETHFQFDKTNSNIDVILGSGPVAVDYDIDGLSNPEMDPDNIGFITDTSRFEIQVLVELPIYGTANNFNAKDTFEVNLSEYDEIEYAEFKIISENQMPLGVDLQMYFADSDNNILDSLLMEGDELLEPAPANSEGITIDPLEKITYIKYDADRFARIKGAKKILLDANFSTWDVNNETNVKILADQGVQVRMGMKLGLKE